MATCVDINWTEQKKPVGEVVAEDIAETLKEYLPAGMFRASLDGRITTHANLEGISNRGVREGSRGLRSQPARPQIQQIICPSRNSPYI